MKRFFLVLIVVMLTISISAQDDGYRTIFDGENMRISGFGGPFMSFGSFNREFCHMMGGGGGIMLGDFFFGGYGMGSTNNIRVNYNGTDYDLDYGHGGLWFGYSIMSEKAIHPAIHLQTGWGTIAEEYDYDQRYSNISRNDDNIFVLTPTIEMEMNFTRFFRVGVGGNCQFVFGSDEDKFGMTDTDLISPGAFLAFKFGWF